MSGTVRRGPGRGVGVSLAVGLAVLACEATEEEPVEPIALEQAQDALERALCDRVAECQCDRWSYYASPDECYADVADELDDLRMRLERPDWSGLQYDPQCMGEYVRAIENQGCRPESLAEACDSLRCVLVHGDVPRGEPCETYGGSLRASDCDRGSVCFQGVCVDPCNPELVPPGPGEGHPCDAGRCLEGLYCDLVTETCVALPGPGDPCLEGQCGPELFCEAEDFADPMSPMRCYAPRPTDEPCRGHGQCASGYCPAGYCKATPTEGESCAGAGVCAAGLDCIDEVCGPGDALLCTVRVLDFY